MTKLLVCIDASTYADNICANAAWAAKRLNADIDLLHVLMRNSDYQAPAADRTGSIGLGARSGLMEKLVKVDEERARIDQQKGRLILEHGEALLKKAGVKNVNPLHRRGGFVETIHEFETDAEIIFIGKRGEQANLQSEFLGSNLEKVARAVHKPLFVVSSVIRPIKRFVIAYDGKESARKAVDFVTTSPLLQGLECHLLTVESPGPVETGDVVEKLKSAGFKTIIHTEKSDHIDEVVTRYVAEQDIDLLLTGAYSHSRLRNFILGSTTATLIRTCHIPLMLFR